MAGELDEPDEHSTGSEDQATRAEKREMAFVPGKRRGESEREKRTREGNRISTRVYGQQSRELDETCISVTRGGGGGRGRKEGETSESTAVKTQADAEKGRLRRR